MLIDSSRQMILGEGENVSKVVLLSLEGLVIRETGSTSMTIEQEAILESIKSVLNLPDFLLDGHDLPGKTIREVLRSIIGSQGVASDDVNPLIANAEKSVVEFCRSYRARMGEGLALQPDVLRLLKSLSSRDDCILVMLSSSLMRVAMMKVVLFGLEGSLILVESLLLFLLIRVPFVGMFSSGGFGCDGETYQEIQLKAIDRVFSKFPQINQNKVQIYSISPYPSVLTAAKVQNIKPIGVSIDSFTQEQLSEAVPNCDTHPDLYDLASILHSLDISTDD